MHSGKDIKKRGARIGGKKKTLRGKRAPSQNLADDEQHAKRKSAVHQFIPSEYDFAALLGAVADNPAIEASRLRPSPSVTLLASKFSVFTYRSRGSSKCLQSGDAPCRTIMALVSAAKDITMAKMPIHTPVSERSGLKSSSLVE